ncbi:MAG: hypothetical protein K9G49_03160 [Taibaiella sp.]|nr:hypothetical protein [Taibaiella sp.]
MKYILSLVMLFNWCLVHGQDYRQYHALINNAERCYFLDNKSDSAYIYYDSAFSRFDFVFARDCFLAAQLAYYDANKKYEQYLRIGFANGLSPEHLQISPVFHTLVSGNVLFKKEFPDYAVLRKKYLSRINVPVLKNITRIAVQEQTHKMLPTEQFTAKLSEHLAYIEYVIKNFGFPGEKLIGLLQPDILAELGYKNADYRAFSKGRATFDGEMYYIAQSLTTPILIHTRCPYQRLEKYWDKCIRNGEIHPDDVALFYDAGFNFLKFPHSEQISLAKDFSCDRYFMPTACFRKNPLTRSVVSHISKRIVDSMRATIFINPLRVDSAKKAFGQVHRMPTCFEWGIPIE